MPEDSLIIFWEKTPVRHMSSISTNRADARSSTYFALVVPVVVLETAARRIVINPRDVMSMAWRG
jgi:hypothetical protein